MKVFIRLTICVVFSLLIQCSVLFYLDAVRLKESTKFTIANSDEASSGVKTNVSAPISSNAKDIEVSYNGRYVTYFDDNKLMLINTKTSEVKQILEKTKILNVEWVPNNNTLFIVENNSGRVNVKTYNALNGVEMDVCELCGYTKNSEVNSFISLSAEYVSIKTNSSTNIYRISIDKDSKRVNKNNITLGNCDVFWSKDVFFFEDSVNKRFYRYTNGVSKKIAFSDANNLVILEAAGNKLYMGEYSDNNGTKMISKIMYGEDETDPSTWKTETLQTPVEIKDIFINENNEIFIINETEKSIKNINSGKSTTYEGTFVSINNRVFSYIKDGKITVKNI